jgi:hypothetical protein
MTDPLPPFLDAQDPRSFAHHTLARRVPRIVGDLLETVALPAPARARLEAAVARPLELAVRRLPLPPGEAPRWEEFFATREGRSLRELPFFEWEAYLYAWLNVEAGYYQTGLDPFAAAKRQDFAAALPSMEAASRAALEAGAHPPRSALRPALLRSLLANLADASNPQIQAGDAAATRLLHADPWEEVEEALLAGPEVLILTDNAMSELWYDLLLARALAYAAPAVRVALVLKRHPTLVSDATPADVDVLWGLIDAAPAAASLGRAAADVRALVAGGRIGLRAWAELNTPWSFAAPGLAPLLGQDVAYVIKGDANFRRALEDRAWEPTAALDRACTAPMARALFLRVLKSECVAGLPAAAVELVERVDPEWRVSGKHATAQLLCRTTPGVPTPPGRAGRSTQV